MAVEEPAEPEATKKPSGSSELKKFPWDQSRFPIPEIYSNYLHTSWSLEDVRLLFGQLKPRYGDVQEFLVEERGAVTMSWAQAKHLATTLTALIRKYEEANGEIKRAKLADRPD
jgi:hypothetical protein